MRQLSGVKVGTVPAGIDGPHNVYVGSVAYHYAVVHTRTRSIQRILKYVPVRLHAIAALRGYELIKVARYAGVLQLHPLRGFKAIGDEMHYVAAVAIFGW